MSSRLFLTIAGVLFGLALSSCSRSVDIELIEAAQNGNADRVKLLIQQGANVNVRATDDWLTPLIAASRAGHLEAVKVLLHAGADINRSDGVGTPLYWAAFDGHREVVKHLLANSGRVGGSKETTEYLMKVMRQKEFTDLVVTISQQIAKETKAGS